MNTAYKFRMYPNRLQEAQLDLTLDTCRHLYNTALADRKTTYEVEGISRSYEDQTAILTLEKRKGNFQGVFAQVLQDVLRRLDKTFKAFFRRVKNGEEPGYPRFKGKGRYDSLTYKQLGFGIKDGKLHLSKIGDIKIKLHRPIEGKIKTCTIRRMPTGKWFACFSVEIEDTPLPPWKDAIGVDVGLKSLVTSPLVNPSSILSTMFRQRRSCSSPKNLSRKRRDRPIEGKPKSKLPRFIRESKIFEMNSTPSISEAGGFG